MNTKTNKTKQKNYCNIFLHTTTITTTTNNTFIFGGTKVLGEFFKEGEFGDCFGEVLGEAEGGIFGEFFGGLVGEAVLGEGEEKE